MEKKKKTLMGVIILVILIVVFALCYIRFSAKPTAGAKSIVIEVTDADGNSTDYDVHTDAEYLKEAMDELAEADSGFSFDGTEGDYGMMVESINGQQAIYTEDNAYWALYVNGEYGQYSADTQPVADGDTYTWKYEAA